MQFLQKSGVFRNSPKSCRSFWLFLLNILLPRNFKNRPIWSQWPQGNLPWREPYIGTLCRKIQLQFAMIFVTVKREFNIVICRTPSILIRFSLKCLQCSTRKMARLFCKNKPSKILVKGRNFPSDGLWCFLSLLLLTRQLKCLVYSENNHCGR